VITALADLTAVEMEGQQGVIKEGGVRKERDWERGKENL